MILEISVEDRTIYIVVRNKDDILKALNKYVEDYIVEAICDELIEVGIFEDYIDKIYCALYYNIIEINRTIDYNLSNKSLTNTNFFLDNHTKL